MAPVSEEIYFPPLDLCLKGERIVLSWRLIATALCDISGERQKCRAVVDFLQDEHIKRLLSEPSSVFDEPNAQNKANYQDRTSAVNAPPSSDGKYDLGKIKEHATWLSENANLNLVAALRIVVIEFQSRPASHLAGPLSVQDAANLREAAGLGNGQDSVLMSMFGAAVSLDAESLWLEFEKEDAAKLRIFNTYLSERRHLMMTVDYVQAIMLYQRLPIVTSLEPGALPGLYNMKDKPALEPNLTRFFDVLRKSYDRSKSGVENVAKDRVLQSQAVAAEWMRMANVEATHSLSIIFQNLDANRKEFAPSACVGAWFSLMADCYFLEDIEPINEYVEALVWPIKTLVAAISFSFLAPPESMQYLRGELDEPANSDDPYLTQPEVLDVIHKSLSAATNHDLDSTAPATLSWTIITHAMCESYQARRNKAQDIEHQLTRASFEESHQLRPSSERRNSSGSMMSMEASRYDSFLSSNDLDKNKEILPQLADLVTSNGRVFDIVTAMAQLSGNLNHTSLSPLLGHRMRSVFIEFLTSSYPAIGYQSHSVSCLVSVLTMGRLHSDQSFLKDFPSDLNVTDVALQNEDLLGLYLQQSLDRYPFEFLPFIKLCRTLCAGSLGLDDRRSDLITKLLARTPTLTFVLPPSFQDFEMLLEESSREERDERMETFILSRDLPLVSWVPARTFANGVQHDFRIPAETPGGFIADSGRVVRIEWEHSGLALLGRRLEVNLNKESYHVRLDYLDHEEIAETIALLADLVYMDQARASQAGTSGALVDPQRDVLSEASAHIVKPKDIISVVCDTMDLYLQDGQATPDDAAVTVLQSCIHFLHAVLPRCPSRVWSYMARCDLLNSDTQAGKLGRIVGNLDLVLERYDFLLATVRLFSVMIDSAMASAVQRKCGQKFVYRQREHNPWEGVADRVLASVSSAMAQATVDLFENSATWRFSSEYHRMSLVADLVPILNKILIYTYGMDDKEVDKNDTAKVEPERLTCCLQTAAHYTADSFLSSSAGSLRFQAILVAFASTFRSPDATLFPHLDLTITKQLHAVSAFVKTLLRIQVYKQHPSSALLTRLFKASTLIARLGSVSYAFKQSSLQLLEVLVGTAGKTSSDPPSLLGYLGTQTSKSLVHILARMDLPFNSTQTQVACWKLFSAIVSNRQQWMTNCLLTGKTPREVLMNVKGVSEPSADSVLIAALKRSTALGKIEPTEALATLEFIMTALNHWPRAIKVLQENRGFLDGLRAYVHDLRAPLVTARTDPVQASVEAKLAAFIAQIFAMQLYHLRQIDIVKSDNLASKLVNDLDYYLRDAAQVCGYNKSLHANFSRNFASQYPKCTLDAFKRTLLEPRELGNSFYYDLERADEMLRFSPGWAGFKGTGYRSEMELANANLSLVDAQVALLNAWRVLLLELGSSFKIKNGSTIARQMLQVTQQCLESNQENQGPEAIFMSIVESRAELSLMLVQRLTGTSLASSEVNDLLGNIYSTFNGLEDPFSPQSIPYTRTLLKLFYVSLRAFTVSEALPAPTTGGVNAKKNFVSMTQTVLNLLDRVVGRGFRTLVSFIHDAEASVSPDDLALLTAILQACLCIPDMNQSQVQILNIMATHDVVRVATALFSWSDKLTIDGDPIYGEFSLLFLVELSTLPLVAEQLACDGVLGNIMSANIIKYMRRNTISATSENQAAQRCYNLWAKGLLPLMLNLVVAMGPTIAPEVAYVLNQFSHLLTSSIDSFEAPGVNRTATRDAPRYLTLLAVSEIHSLALLTRVLGALRANNSRDIAEVSWDAGVVLGNVDFWLSTRRLLRERLLPLGSREMDWAGMPTGKTNQEGQSENKLEEKVVRQLEAVRDILSDEIEE